MRYYCTYFDRNYLTLGLALIDSLKRWEGTDFRLIVVCLDELTRFILKRMAPPQVVLLPLHQLEKHDVALRRARINRSVVEYYWTLTPTVLTRILDAYPEIDRITYLDADLYFFSSPAPIFEEMGGGQVMIHEHRFAPGQRHLERYGRYNVGLLSFRRGKEASKVLAWWRERCNEWCYARLEEGRFGDQLYLEDWPRRFEDVVVLQHIGAGVAPWNHIQYTFGRDGGGVTVDGRQLIFYHFHSLAFVEPDIVLPTRIAANPLNRDVLAHCFAPYATHLRENVRRVREAMPGFSCNLRNPGLLEKPLVAMVARGTSPLPSTLVEKRRRIDLDPDWCSYWPLETLTESSHVKSQAGNGMPGGA